MNSSSFPTLPDAAFRLQSNPGAAREAPYGDAQLAVLSAQGLADARRCISGWPGYVPTPLVELPGLAARLGIGAVYYKQEAARFGLRSFKPLGGAYAVQRCLMRRVAEHQGVEDVSPESILQREHADIVAQLTVTAATDGNHGRSVAWGARMFGCRCIIYINEAVSAAREQAIAVYGAQVRRHPGSFDDAVRKAFAMARDNGWEAIPDTSDGIVVEAPRDVTQGYAVMAAEAIEQLPRDAPPTHMFVQAGVGGMAGATCAEFWRQFASQRPCTVLVEPMQSACWFESLLAGQPTAVTGDIDSFMGGLSCGEVSTLAWPVLSIGADAAMVIDDTVAAPTMQLLADGHAGDPPLVGGESGVAGLAGLIVAAQNSDARRTLGFKDNARVIVFGTEGATDEALYERVVGRPWQEVCP
jgi:diaminopropionate ammonia-lyase